MDEESMAIVSRFETEWRSGGEPSIEAAVAGVPDEERVSLVALLVAKDCRFRKAKKQLVDFDAYAARFPCLVDTAGEWHADFLAALEATSASRQVPVEADTAATLDSESGAAAGKPEMAFQGDAVAREQVAKFGIKIPGYDITDRLGEGGMGVVWKATQLATKRQVALKCAAGRNLDSSRARATFEREVELAAMLEHPNIARVYDSGIHDGVYYYALELLDGQEMDDFVDERGLDETEVVALMVKVCHAVEVAHQRGVIHRDLKPGNIMVTADGEPHVLDFGLAKSLEGTETNVTMTQEGSVSGTLAFMAPEQASGRVKDMDTRTDVYALGAILYRLIVGKSHHDMTGGQVAILCRIAEEEVARPRSQKEDVDAEMEAILLKALSRERDERYRSAGDLGEELENYLSGSPISAAPATLSYFLKKRLRRHKLAVAMATMVMVAVMVAVVFYVVSISEERARTQAQREIAEGKAAEAAESARVANEKAEAARRNVYFNDVALALAEYHNGNISRAKEILNQCPEDLRRWEWHFLDRVCTVRRHEYKGATDVVYGIDYSPDGEVVAAYSRDGTLRFWRRGETEPFLKQDKIGGMAGQQFTPDGRYYLSRSYRRDRIDIRQATDFEIIKQLEVEEMPWNFAISPDSKLFAHSTKRKTIELRQIPSLDLVAEVPISGYVRFLPGGKRLIVNNRGFQIVEISTGKIEPVKVPPDFKHGSTFRTSPSGEIIYQVRGRLIEAWNRLTGELLFARQLNGSIDYFDVSPDGRYLVYPNWKSVFLYDAQSGEQVRVYRRRAAHNFYHATFSPDMQEVAVGFKGIVYTWPLQIERLSEGAAVSGMPVDYRSRHQRMNAVLSSSGRWAAGISSGVNNLIVSDLHGGIDHLRLKKHTRSFGVAFTRDEKFLLCAAEGWALRLIELATGKTIWKQVLLVDETAKNFSLQDVELSASGQVVFVVFMWTGPDKRNYARTQARDMGTGELLWSRDHTATGGWRFLIEVPGTGEHLFVSTVYGFQKLDADTGEMLREYNYRRGGGGDQVRAMSLSPDGKMMLFTCHANGTTIVADLEKWETKFNLLDHDTEGSAVAWSPDSERFFTGSMDHKILVWDAESGRRIMTLDNKGHVGGLAFTPDGRNLVSFGGVFRKDRIKTWRSGIVDGWKARGKIEGVIEPGIELDLLSKEFKFLAANEGEWSNTDSGLFIHKRNGYPGVNIPIRILGSYRLEGEMDNAGRLCIHLPVGKTDIRWFLIDRDCFLEKVDGEKRTAANPTYSQPFKTSGKRRKFSVDVDVFAESAHIVAKIDGRELINWSGDFSRLETDKKDSLLMGTPDLLSFGQGPVFSSLKLTIKDGLAYRLMDLPEPSAASVPKTMSSSVSPSAE